MDQGKYICRTLGLTDRLRVSAFVVIAVMIFCLNKAGTSEWRLAIILQEAVSNYGIGASCE